MTMVEAPDVYEPTAEETVSDTVIRALADSKGVDPAQLDVRLYDVVDPDALDRLCASGGGCRVAFTYADRRVVVDGGGTVHITGLSVLVRFCPVICTVPPPSTTTRRSA